MPGLSVNKLVQLHAPYDPLIFLQIALARADGLLRVSAEPVTEGSSRPAAASVKPGDREAAAGASPTRGTCRNPDSTWLCWVSLFDVPCTCLMSNLRAAAHCISQHHVNPCQWDGVANVTETVGKSAYSVLVFALQCCPYMQDQLCQEILHDLANPILPTSGLSAMVCHADLFSAHRQISHKQGTGYDAGRGLALACWR